MHSLKDELVFFFSSRGMPYVRVAIVVATVVTILLGGLLSNNYSKDVNVTVIDLDNSKYSHEFIEKMNASPFIKINAVLNMATEPARLFYEDKCVAVVYLPKDFEKNHYNNSANEIGVFYDNTNSSQTGDLKVAINELIAIENQMTAASNPATAAYASSGIAIKERVLFNPVNSSSNGEVLAFLFFFSSMFYVFATIGIIPRLRLEHKWEKELHNGNPFGVFIRIIPYSICLIVALFYGMAVLRIVGDLTITGNIFVFLLSLFIYIPALGILSMLFGWTAANPGVAASRMILFIPGGFILGGFGTGPLTILSELGWIFAHFFPLTWEYHFIRDILLRGASFMDCGKMFGALMLYLALVIVIFCFCFYRGRKELLKNTKLQECNLVEMREN